MTSNIKQKTTIENVAAPSTKATQIPKVNIKKEPLSFEGSSGSLSNVLKKTSSNDLDIDKVESIVAQLISEMIETIELQSLEPPPVTEPIESMSTRTKTNSDIQNGNNQQYLIDACLTALKQLCHTFIQSHLLQKLVVECGTGDHQRAAQDDIDKAFASLFYSNSEKRSEICFKPNSEIGLHLIEIKRDCLTFLYSFQILNKLLIKILYFPRESDCWRTNANSSMDGLNSLRNDENRDRVIASLIDGFEDWVKDLFVISCSSSYSSPSNIFNY